MYYVLLLKIVYKWLEGKCRKPKSESVPESSFPGYKTK